MTTNPKVLVSCLNFYPNEEEYYKKVLAKIIDINGFSEGLIFHNKIYAVKYRKHKASCMYDMFYEIIDFERENKQYFKALTAEIKAAVLTLKEGGKSV